MTKDEALKLALDALEGFIPYLQLKDEAQCNSYDKAITALRLAIDEQNMASKSTYKEQLETKDAPVAWMSEDEHTVYTSKQVDGCFQHDHIPLYTTPQRTWVGMTDEEKAQFVVAYYPSNWDRKTAVSLMNDYEKYLKEKNHV